jgi:hypothetical protein
LAKGAGPTLSAHLFTFPKSRWKQGSDASPL